MLRPRWQWKAHSPAFALAGVAVLAAGRGLATYSGKLAEEREYDDAALFLQKGSGLE
jgi:hypothetical protein